MLNPCCCISPRIGTFIFAIFDLVVSCAYALDVIRVLIDHSFHYEIWGEVALCICLVLLAILLLLGAIRNSQEKVRLWLILWLVFLIVMVVFQVFNVWRQNHLGYRQGSSIGGLLLFFYQIWVVYAFLTELRYGPAGLTYCPSQIV